MIIIFLFIFRIVEDFEVIAAAFADQPIVGEITFTTQDVAFVAENVSLGLSCKCRLLHVLLL